MPPDPLSLQADAHAGEADQLYLDRGWADALSRYERLAAGEPERAVALSLPLQIGHCRLELAADPVAVGATLPAPAGTGSTREDALVRFMHGRALELCRAGDTARASALLRFGAPCDAAMAEAYATDFAPGHSPPRALDAASREPPFLAAHGIASETIPARKRRHAGQRLLLVLRRFYYGPGPFQSEVIHFHAVSARRFGFTVDEFPYEPFRKGADPSTIPSLLLQHIIDFRPDLILYDSGFPYGLPRRPSDLPAQILAVFEMVRGMLGTRVVLSHTDAWMEAGTDAEALFAGLGTAVDLVQHLHPAALGLGTPAQQAATFCFVHPVIAPPPTVAPDTIPRACFAGGIAHYNIARLAWWAECGRRGLPVDFFEAVHTTGAVRSDQDYVNLFAAHQLALNFSRRTGGPKIITGRSIDVPLSGGLLVEETSPDLEYFLTPGLHYVPFGTIDDLAALIPELLADPGRRAAIRRAGRDWAARYFTGDYFWTGLLCRLD